MGGVSQVEAIAIAQSWGSAGFSKHWHSQSTLKKLKRKYEIWYNSERYFLEPEVAFRKIEIIFKGDRRTNEEIMGLETRIPGSNSGAIPY